MAIVSRQPFSDQIEILGEKGVSIIGSLMESLVGALAEGYLEVAIQPLYSRYTAVIQFRPGLALRLAEGYRGLYRAQPVILPSSSSLGVTLSPIIFPYTALYRSRASISRKALSGSYINCVQLVHLTSTFVAPLVFLEFRISVTNYGYRAL